MKCVKLLPLLILFIGLLLYSFSYYEDDFQLVQLTSTNEDGYFCSWNSGGDKILYNYKNHLWILDIKDESKVQLTKSGFNAWGEFSPDGSKIAFVFGLESPEKRKKVYTSGELWILNYSICVMDLMDKRTKCLTKEGFNYNPKWSPDGNKIAFARIEGFRIRHIWVMDADGNNQPPLTHDLRNVECWSYDWSPDGSKIVFSANISGEHSVWVMNADGSNKKKLADGGSPTWVSENTIAYIGNNSNLYRMTLEGEKELLVEDAVLCYSINRDGDVVYKNWDNISIAYDGNRKELTENSRDLCPVFRPDGRKIAFMSERTGNADIWMIKWEKQLKLW